MRSPPKTIRFPTFAHQILSASPPETFINWLICSGYINQENAVAVLIKEVLDELLDLFDDSKVLPTIIVRVKQSPLARQRRKGGVQVTLEMVNFGIKRQQAISMFGRQTDGGLFSRGRKRVGAILATVWSMKNGGRGVAVTIKQMRMQAAIRFRIQSNLSDGTARVFLLKPARWKATVGSKIEFACRGRVVRRGKNSLARFLRAYANMNSHLQIEFYDGKNLCFGMDRSSVQAPLIDEAKIRKTYLRWLNWDEMNGYSKINRADTP